MITTSSFVALVAAAVLGTEPGVSFQAPGAYIKGEPFQVELSLTAEAEMQVPAWVMTPAAFTLGGAPLADRGDQTITLAPGTDISMRVDLAPYLGGVSGEFSLGLGDATLQAPAVTVNVLEPAGEGLSFMEMPAEELGNYQVLLRTNQGDMLVEFWPDVAPNHSRNFLDLSYTDFYDGLIFHRVAPGFMIQGGDPEGTGSGSGPRSVDAEFSDRKHLRGVLSMARLGHDVNSATSQFFIMHAPYPSLDGQYSAFGQMVWGDAALDAIANAPGKPLPAGGNRPNEPQRIEKAIVIKKRAE